MCEKMAGLISGARVANATNLAAFSCEEPAGLFVGTRFAYAANVAAIACEKGAGIVAGTGSSGYDWLVGALVANPIASPFAIAVGVLVVLLDARRCSEQASVP